MAKIYKGSITKDHLPTVIVIGGAGALIVVAMMAVLYLWIHDVTGAGTELGDIALNVGVSVLLFFVGIGGCFYLLWRGVNERVVVEDRGFRYTSAFVNRLIPAMDVEKVMIFDHGLPVVIYDVNGELKRLKLPKWKSSDYIDDLVAELKRMNPNVEISDLRKNAEVRYEKAAPEEPTPK